MTINCDLIGLWAGQVWEAVNDADTISTKQIKKITKLKDKELYAALGWLAREGKVSFQTNDEDEKELLIQLVQG
ncbi:MAG: winged helix-turn-helix domain-containing protein [Candidatus Amulumruptor caecigallinarius]|nr:winged helix-turn-helix domain-containing protein [Candidatus Amulumruptor caecigallinarius]MCM1397183.1 winged helix-turn-helix domain-containing protein [Candidatus Amulumruptor caecigallinarius]MCM1453128.1 winged helix-turn-helix domain-containing protein [bacterium]